MNNKSERGQSLVELAISLVVLLYLLSGAVELGILFFQYVQLRDAAQEGALYGSTKPYDLPGIEARIRGASGSPIDLQSPDVTIKISADGIDSGDAAYYTKACEGWGIKVEVSFTHKVFMPFMPKIIGRDTIPLTGSVTDTILSPYKPTTPAPCSPPP
ncbi:MAG TPA: TadE family protein [Anaerolineales bacterium]|nr:TadE family protein [Anaerolineales bacterium]